jgi:hypothetical protein
MRVLIAFEDDYRIYQDMIAAAIELERPRVEVVTAEVNELETQARSFEPHLIICSGPRIENPIDALGWIQLSPLALTLSAPALKDLDRRAV